MNIRWPILANMAEQWISAASAVRIVGGALPLCARLHSGLVVSRATKLQIDDREQTGAKIPKAFWWATGHGALEQNWETGDFSTWVDRDQHWQAFGVTFELSGLLDMVEFERRPMIARSLSVAANKDWVSAREARQLSYAEFHHGATKAGPAIIEQARLGFVAGRAVLAQVGNPNSSSKVWEEREWNIPTWFWAEFTGADRSNQDWELGRFSGKGRMPEGVDYMTLSGVHFLRESLSAVGWRDDTPDIAPTSGRGRRQEYDWETAANAIWGQIYRAELIPKNQAQIEHAMQALLRKGDKEPSESTVRPYASRIWSEFSK